MGAKARYKNCSEPVKYRAPSIMIFMQKKRDFLVAFFKATIYRLFGAKVAQSWDQYGILIYIHITFKLINKL